MAEREETGSWVREEGEIWVEATRAGGRWGGEVVWISMRRVLSVGGGDSLVDAVEDRPVWLSSKYSSGFGRKSVMADQDGLNVAMGWGVDVHILTLEPLS